jgi:hypothetical protein
MIQIPKPYIPSPWKLRGEAIMMAYRIRQDWVAKQGFLPAYLLGHEKSGLGFVMLVNYQRAPVGPYKELLFMPGPFAHNGKRSITKIYVDSEDSTRNGRYNWGIPKETAAIQWVQSGQADHISVTANGTCFFDCRISSGGIPFPVHTALLPIHLHQQLNGRTYITRPEGKGWGRLARIRDIQINPDYFPDISLLKPIAAIRVSPFFMQFPEAVIEDDHTGV